MKSEEQLIEDAKKKAAKFTANAWKPAPDDAKAKERFDAGEGRASGPLRLDSDAERANEIRRSVNVDADDDEEDDDTAAFNARVDTLERERETRVRTDARARENASDPIAKATAANEQKMRDAWKVPQVG